MDNFDTKKNELRQTSRPCNSKIYIYSPDYKNTNLHYKKMVLTKKKYSGHAMLNTFYILSEKSLYFLVGVGSYFMFDGEITSLLLYTYIYKENVQ